jgi:hypothetical protein
MIVILSGLLISLFLVSFLKVKFKYVAIMNIVLLTLVAYLFDPQIALIKHGFYTDLVRIFNELRIIKDYTFKDAFLCLAYPFNSEYSGLWLNNIIMFLCSKSNKFNLLSCFSSIVSYSVLFLTLNRVLDYCKQKRVIRIFSIIMVFCLTDYVSVICNIRNPIALFIDICVLYWDLVERKNTLLCFSVYILMIFIHPMTILVLLLRISLYFCNNFVFKALGVVIGISMLSFPFIGKYIISKFSNAYIASLGNKIIAYGGAQEDLQSYGNNTLLFITIYSAVALFFSIKVISKYNSDIRFNKFVQICFIILCIFAGSYYCSIHLFYRVGTMVSLCLLLISPIALVTLKEKYGDINKKRNFITGYSLYFLLICGLCLVNFLYKFGTVNYQMLNLGF